MEPFALMQFLQSIFAQNPQNSPQNTDDRKTETPSPTNPPDPSTVAEEKTEQTASKQSDAILDFMQKHETRARRIRKDQ